MKIAGIILILFGLVDLIGSYTGFDLWGSMGVALPEMIWKISAFIEIGLGYLLFKMGSGSAQPAEEAE